MQLQNDKSNDYIISWISKGSYSFTLSPQYIHFLNSLNFFGYEIGIKFNRNPLVVKQMKCATKIINVYIVFELNLCPKSLLEKFTLKNCLFGATNIVENSDRSKWVYSGYRIVFDGKGVWSFGNGFARNRVATGVDNSSSSHSDNRKNNFLISGEGPTSDINGSFGSPEKKV